MRLPAPDRAAIETAFRAAFPRGTRLVLFGSRVDDARRGGDIDLLIEHPEGWSAADAVERRIGFVAHIYRLLDERRVDVLMAREGADDPRAVVREARRHGMELLRT